MGNEINERVNEAQQILGMIKQGEITYIDNHNGGEETLQGIIKYDGQICPAYKDTYFSINPLYIGIDGKLHLSQASIGGVVDTRGKSLRDAVLKFNALSIEYPWGGMISYYKEITK